MEVKTVQDIAYVDVTIPKGTVLTVLREYTNFIEVIYKGKQRSVMKISVVEVEPATDHLDPPPEVERPDSAHYHTGGIDVWKFAEANFNYDEVFGFHRINAIKYLTRFGKKQGRNIRDLEKARAEIDEMIRMEKERAEND